MQYYFANTIESDFDSAVERATSALKEGGFGVLTDIDIQATLREKLGLEGDPYRILGACNPPFAHRALDAEPHVGLMLPCNVIVRAVGDGRVEVAAVDPVAQMGGIENAALEDVAEEVRGLLQAVIERV